jgi:hypothetical protein
VCIILLFWSEIPTSWLGIYIGGCLGPVCSCWWSHPTQLMYLDTLFFVSAHHHPLISRSSSSSNDIYGQILFWWDGMTLWMSWKNTRPTWSSVLHSNRLIRKEVTCRSREDLIHRARLCIHRCRELASPLRTRTKWWAGGETFPKTIEPRAIVCSCHALKNLVWFFFQGFEDEEIHETFCFSVTTIKDFAMRKLRNTGSKYKLLNTLI